MSTPRADLAQLSPLQRAALAIQELRAQLDQARAAAHAPIAIIGLGCRFPGGPDPDAFWASLRAGTDESRELPRDRFDLDALYDPDPAAVGKIYTRRGYFLDDVRGFDAGLFAIAPREAEAMDPQHRLLLELAWACFEHAGLAPDRMRGSQTGVFVGLMNRDYAELSPAPAHIEAHTGAGNSPAIAAGRIAHVLDLRGPALTIDTACSSSLVAIHLAVASLRRREIDFALAGGVNLNLTPWALLTECRARMLAADGRCKAFDAAADGFARGEGGGLLALARLDDALAAGRRILAVIRGSAVNHDGTSSGLTVPNADAQVRVIRAALDDARLPAERVDYVEAHGTGTALGDPIEVDALARVFATGARRTALRLASVKTHIGHLESAAGVAGVIKTVLALGHRELPAHLHLAEPSPRIPWAELPIELVRARQPWPTDAERPVAGVSSFGAGGTNAHLVLEAAPAERVEASADGAIGPAPIVLAAHDAPALRALAASVRGLPPDVGTSAAGFADLRATINLGRAKLRERLAILVEDRAGLDAALDSFLAGGEPPPTVVTGRRGELGPCVFAFTGQGAQFTGMGRALYTHQPVFRAALDHCAELVRALGGPPVLAVIGLDGDPALAEAIDRTDHAQLALFCVQHALVELWRSWGVVPDLVLGHSLGELSAAHVAGVFTLEDGLRLVLARGRAMQAVDAPGAMLEVRADEAELSPLLAENELAIAAVNAPRRVVVSGARPAIDALAHALAARGLAAQRLRVSHAFHSPLMAPAVAPFLAAARTVALHAPTLPLISNRTGGLADAAFTEPTYWAEHILHPVRFADGLAAAIALGARAVIEIGPRPVLSMLGQLAHGDAGVRFIPTLRGGDDARAEAYRALAELHVAGARVDWAALERGRVHRHVELPTYPFQRRPYWVQPAAPAPALPADALLTVRWHAAPRPAFPLRALDDADRAALAVEVHERARTLASDGATLAGLDALVCAWASRAVAELGGATVAAHLRRPFAVIRDHAARSRATVDDPAALAATLAAQAPALAPVIELISRTGPRLASVLRGDVDPTAVLFPDGDLELAATLYRDTPGARLIHGALPTLVARTFAEPPRDRPWRILEIGGGTGATTAALLPRLAGCRYDFTDVSPRFVGRARARFADHDGFDARSLDIERDPAAQGFAPASYDLIVAANVVHATAALDDTLARLAGLLAPGGQLWLIEATRPAAWVDVSFALTDGWWRFTDERSRPDSPLLTTADWAHRLRAAGFATPLGFEPDDDAPVLPAQALIVATKIAPPAQRWRIVAEPDDALAAGLTAALRARGAHVEDDAPDHVVYLAGTAPPAQACADVLDLLAVRGAAPARLWLITRGATAARPPVDPRHAALWGLARVIAVEAPEQPCTCIDLAPDLDPDPDALAPLVDELLSGGDEDQLALRSAERLCARLAPVHDLPAHAPPRLDPTAYYLVAGGGSGLGLCAVEWLAARGARHVITLGRRGEPALPADARARLAAVRERGVALTALAVDICDREALARALAPALADPHHRLAGVIHAVGVVRDRTLRHATRDDFAAVLAPKLDGAHHLHALTCDLALDRFVIFSSGAGLWGPIGQANHAAANAYLDAFAAWRAERGLPTRVIDWGAVHATGAAADPGVIERVHGMGLEVLSIAGFTEALDRAWADAPIQMAVLPRRPGPLPAPWSHRPFLRTLAGAALSPPTPASPASEPAWRAALHDVPGSRRPARLRALLADALTDVLHLHQPPDDRDGFFDLGMDSLTAVEFRQRVQRELALPLPGSVVFDYPNLRALADHLAGVIDPAPIHAPAVITTRAASDDTDLAIVGMACRFPGGADLGALWATLRDGVDCSGPVPAGRWPLDAAYHAHAGVTRGSFLPEVAGFDAEFFAISPSEARRMDPQHRLLLELAWEAFEHAAIAAPDFDRGSTGVFVGVSGDDYARLISRAGLAAIDAMVGTGTSSSAAAGRLSHALGLTGPAFAVNTGCSSALVAVHLARQSVLRGECRAALAGGVSLMLGPDAMVMTARARMLAADGRCKTFSADADGYGRGEGGGLVVIKRLDDARRDGDRVLAILRGSAINQDGRTSGLTVPHGPAQQAVIRRALAEANVLPDAIDYVEAHGTGTPLGDPIEVGALAAVFGPGRTRPLAIGTVKTNLGHLEAAAGIAGLIKTVLALEHGLLPPHLHFRAPSPHIAWDAAPIEVVDQLRAWPAAHRHTGVSSFGFTGTNAHVVLARGDAPSDASPAHVGVLCFAAKTPAALDALEARYRAQLAIASDGGAVLCAAAHLGRTHFRAARRALLIDDGAVIERVCGEPRGDLLADDLCVEGLDRRALARLYVDGAAIDWRRVHGDHRPVIDLPAYPWQRERFWFDDEPDRPLEVQALPRQPGARERRFEVALSARAPSWLADHALDLAGRRAPVFPAAAWLAIAIEAARQLRGTPALELVDLRFERPLVLDADARYMLQVVCTPADRSIELAIYAAAAPAPGSEPAWQRYVHATVHDPAAPPPPPRAIEVPLADRISLAAHHAACEARGIVLGPRFRGLTAVALVDGEVRATAQLPAGLTADPWLHPVLLDSCLQGAGAPLYADGLAGTWVPAAIERVRVFATTECLAAAGMHARWRPPADDAIVGDLAIVAPTGAYVAELTGLRFERLAARDDAWRSWLLRMDWQPAAVPGHALLPALAELADDAQPALAERWAAAAGGGYADVLTALEARARQHIERALAGFDRATVAPRHRRLLARLTAILDTQQGAALAGAGPERALLDRTGPALAEVLRGAVDPLHLLFPHGDASWVTRLYSESAAAVTMNGALRDLIDAALRTRPAQRPLRVLEIGAGTGSTTAAVLDRFDPETTRYVFTDVSAHLLAGAAERFADHRFLDYARLDIEADPIAQGFARAGFDLVIAANVLHATHTLADSLAHARRLLAPGGVLLVLETTRRQAWTDVTFGLTEGWWRFAADGYRADHPLIDAPTWCRALGDAGLTDVRAFAPEDSATVAHLAIIAGRAPSIEPSIEPAGRPRRRLILTDRGGLGDALAHQLRAAGDVVDCLPASRRGELDAALAARFDDLLHLWGLDLTGDLTDDAAARAAIDAGVLSAAAGVRAWSGHTDATVLVVSRGAVFDEVGARAPRPVIVDGAAACFQAPLWGFARVAGLELTGLRVVCVDLDPCPDPADATYLHEELRARDSREDRVIVRAGQRRVARLVRDPLAPSPAPDTARAWLAGDHGSLDELQLAPIPRRPPGPGEIELRVHAAGVNFKDLLIALGAVPGERRLGLECAGEIVALGAGVDDRQLGERVVAMAPGSFASHVTVAASAVAAVGALSASTAAALPSAYLTALHGLVTLAQLQPGERVLIHAATGGVGLAAIAVAHARGAEVWATASPAKWPVLRRLGVHRVMSSRTRAFAPAVLAATGGRGVDVVLDSLTGDGFIAASLACCAPGGRFVELAQRGAWTAAEVARRRPDVRYHHFDLQAELRGAADGGRAALHEAIAHGARTAMPVVTRCALGALPAALALMQRGRHVGKIVVDAAPPPRVRPDATYVITGGLTGLGLAHAQWLVARGARHLALIGRRDPAHPAAIAAMRAAGAQVLTLRADVGVRAELAAALDEIRAACPPIAGVVHAAGALADASVAALDDATAWRVLGGKLLGAWNLHCLTRDLDSFVLFSAAASIIGNKGQAHHAAANAFLDALAAWRRRAGLPALVINWGAVADVGAAAGPEVQARLAGLGLAAIPASAVSPVIEAGLAGGHTQLIVLPPAPGGYALADEPLVSALQPAATTDAVPDAAPAPALARSLHAQLAAATTEQARHDLVANRVREHVAALLGFASPSRVGVRRPFFELGLDSLTALELRNRIVAELPCRLEPTFAFALPTVEELTAALVEQLAPTPAPAPEEVPASLSTQELTDLLAAELAALAEEARS